MTEFIIDLSEVEKSSDRFKFLFNESIPLGKRIVRCRDCLSWHKGYCYKHAYEVANEYGDTFTEGVFPMDDSDFCSRGEGREP